MRLPKEYVIVEIIPSHPDAKKGFIVQLQALKIKDNKIIERLDLRVNNKIINNPDLINMISYDKQMFRYVNDKNDILKKFIKFINKDRILLIDNNYTLDYLKDIRNPKASVFQYLGLELSPLVFDKLIKKYQLEPSNHLVDLLYEAIIFENQMHKQVK